ncbi:hypothetical protein DFH08DRAFT_78145 [Mycena albidolilacea]|uniref:Uncharacterized protein n=1 Tax=Mycena albidolilacea TaxID=1033008 RepID=A0AAD7EUH9_9AGAR|nr:hypothetical protein DFH08DRAFT_78145 [Mycena albidolilacea]
MRAIVRGAKEGNAGRVYQVGLACLVFGFVLGEFGERGWAGTQQMWIWWCHGLRSSPVSPPTRPVTRASTRVSKPAHSTPRRPVLYAPSPTQLADPRSTSKTSSPTPLHSLRLHNDVKPNRGRQTPRVLAYHRRRRSLHRRRSKRGDTLTSLAGARGRVGTARARCVYEYGVETGRASTPSLRSIPEYQLPGLQRFKG